MTSSSSIFLVLLAILCAILAVLGQLAGWQKLMGRMLGSAIGFGLVALGGALGEAFH